MDTVARARAAARSRWEEQSDDTLTRKREHDATVAILKESGVVTTADLISPPSSVESDKQRIQREYIERMEGKRK